LDETKDLEYNFSKTTRQEGIRQPMAKEYQGIHLFLLPRIYHSSIMIVRLRISFTKSKHNGLSGEVLQEFYIIAEQP